MPSHLSSIGISVESEEEFDALAEKAAQDAVELPCDSGQYLRWTSDQGAELWMQIDHTSSLVGLTPFFRGKSEFRVGITRAVKKPDDTKLEGAIHGWADPEVGNPKEGAYPFVFDLVDKGLYERFDFPFISPVQLCAFAEELSLYDSDEEFSDSQDSEMKWAAEAFIPSGLFTPEGDTFEPPHSYGMFAGHILESRELSNPLTNQKYQWMFVRTLGGAIDVVSDSDLVSKPPVVGGVAFGTFWLCGRILEPKISERKGLLQRLFRK